MSFQRSKKYLHRAGAVGKFHRKTFNQAYCRHLFMLLVVLFHKGHSPASRFYNISYWRGIIIRVTPSGGTGGVES